GHACNKILSAWYGETNANASNFRRALFHNRGGNEWLTLFGNEGPVHWAQFTADGQIVLAATEYAVRRWPLDPLPRARALKPRDLTEADSFTFRSIHTLTF